MLGMPERSALDHSATLPGVGREGVWICGYLATSLLLSYWRVIFIYITDGSAESF
jgi:hypothetical protein